MRDEQALGILGAPGEPTVHVLELPGRELVPLIHGRVIASTRGYTGRWVNGDLVRTDVHEHFVDEPGGRTLLRMRLSRSLGAKGKGVGAGRVP